MWLSPSDSTSCWVHGFQENPTGLFLLAVAVTIKLIFDADELLFSMAGVVQNVCSVNIKAHNDCVTKHFSRVCLNVND